MEASSMPKPIGSLLVNLVVLTMPRRYTLAQEKLFRARKIS